MRNVLIALLLASPALASHTWIGTPPTPVFTGGGVNRLTGLGNGLTISTGTTFTSSVTVSGSTFTVTGTGINCASFDSPTLVIDCLNHRVGIGTASPATLLHLSSGTLTIDGGTAAIVSSGPLTAGDIRSLNLTAPTTFAELNGSGTSGFLNFQNLPGYIGTISSNQPLHIRTAGVNRINIDGAGLVGIGTDSPSSLFQVGGGTFAVTTAGMISIGTMTVSGLTAPPNGFALCLSSGQMGHCTTTPTNGACTCVAP